MKRSTGAGFEDGAVRILDGGTGTELQRRGAPMTPQAWCGPAAIENVGILEDIHRDYLRAGADVLTANTYAGSRQLLAMDGFGGRFEEINRAAVRAAFRAKRDLGRSDVLIAGSLSHRGPIAEGSARPEALSEAATEEMAASLRELARLLRDEGCDLILLEMMYDPARMPLAYAAAAETGLPIWAGFSARRGPEGEVLGFDPGEDVPFERIVSVLDDWEVEAAGVMHTPSDLVSDALGILRERFGGPLMAYPDSGWFRSPHWQFEDVIRPEDLRAFAEGWVAEGVQVVGGCCGLSPEHVAAVAQLGASARSRRGAAGG